MRTLSTNFYTADQLRFILSVHRITEPLPTKKTKLLIAFPNGILDTITVHNKKSTYGKTLYKSVLTEH